MVLGNHDLHLLAVRFASAPCIKGHPATILQAADGDELLHWLRTQPLMHLAMGYVLCHAGIPPVEPATGDEPCSRSE